MTYTEKDKVHAREKARRARTEPVAVRRSNWIRDGEEAPICSIHQERAVWHKNRARSLGGQWVCKTCSRLKSKGQRRRWKTEHIDPFTYNLKKSFTMAKHHSKKVGREFSIEFNAMLEMWKLQDGNCDFCHRPMDYLPGDHSRNPRKCTIDRIDSAQGYTKENVHLLCDQCNRAKQELAQDELIQFAHGVLRFFNCPLQ